MGDLLDPVAVDATCARLIGLDPFRMPYLVAASRFLGNIDARQVDQRRRERGPSFADIEAAIGQQPDKLWFARASQSVHVTLDATGQEQLHGIGDDENVQHVACLTACSLPMPTIALVSSWPDPGKPGPDFERLAQLVAELGLEAASRCSPPASAEA